MAYVISDECVACGTCAGECPVEAISEGDGTAPSLCYLVTVCSLHSYIIFSFCDFPAWRRPFFWIVDVAGSLHPIFGNVLLSSPSVQYRESGVP